MTPDTSEDSAHFGIWPTLAGIVGGLALVVLMFTLATGFW
jgi:nitrate reductase NapE component